MNPLICLIVLISVCACEAKSEFLIKDSIRGAEQFPFGPSEVKRSYGNRRVPAIAFHVTFDGTLTGSQRVPYDHVLTNEGSGFDILYHAFRAPRGGLYVFGVEAISRLSYGCIQLQKNHHIITIGKVYWSRTRIAIHAPVRLQAGDIVYVKLCGKTSLENKYGMNSFIGYRVSP